MTIKTREALTIDINNDIADNTDGLVNPEDVRSNMIDAIDSAVFPQDTSSLLVNVNAVGDFPDPVGNIITLDSTKVYHMGAMVDIGVFSLEVPIGGVSISALNGGRDVAGITSSEDNHTMFTSPAGSYSGNVLLSEISITTSGTNSKVFDLDNDGNSNSIDINGINFVSCTSLGELTAYRQLFMLNVGFIFIDDGLTFNGTWSGGLSANQSVAIGFPASATLFKEGTSLSFQGSVTSDMNFLSTDVSSEFMNFDEANIASDQGLTLSGFRTAATDAMPNLLKSSVKAKYTGCTGIENTHVGGEYAIGTATATTISSTNTLVKMAGTTTYSDLQWFSQTTNNAFVYDSDQTIEIQIEGSLSFSNTNNKVMGLQIRLWDDSAAAYVNIGSSFSTTFDGNGSAQGLAFFGRTLIDQNDRIELWVENQSDTSNITADVGGFVGISER